MSVAPPRNLEDARKSFKKARHPAAKKAESTPSSAAAKCVKTVVRLLPPALTEEVFFKQLASYTDISPEVVVSSYYVGGHYSKTPYQRPTYSRCYILFTSRDTLEKFVKDIQNKSFIEDQGPRDSLIPVVTNSPFYNDMPPAEISELPKDEEPRKPDEPQQEPEATPKRIATIEDDSRFAIFLRYLLGEISSYSLDVAAQISQQEKRKKLLLKKQQLRARAKAKALKRDNDLTNGTKPKKSKKKLSKQKEKTQEADGPEPAEGATPVKAKSKSKKRNSKKTKAVPVDTEGAKGTNPTSADTPAPTSKPKKRNKPKAKNTKASVKADGTDADPPVKPKQKKNPKQKNPDSKTDKKAEKLQAEKTEATPTIAKPKKIFTKKTNPAPATA